MCSLQGVLDAYEHTLGVVELYGPTNFSSILSKAITYATSSVVSQGDQHYYILLIITVCNTTNYGCRVTFSSDYVLFVSQNNLLFLSLKIHFNLFLREFFRKYVTILFYTYVHDYAPTN